jgi:hypothetical protein
MFVSIPILNRVGEDNVTFADASLMAWGGLRGAVGLVLAIQVHNDLAPDADGVPQITQKDGERLLFFVSGIAFLTMVVNAVTAPALVHKLGIIALPHARQQLLKMFHQQLVNWSEAACIPKNVTTSLKEMLHEAEHEIDVQKIKRDGPQCSRVEGKHGAMVRDREHGGSKTRASFLQKNETDPDDDRFQSNQDLIDEFLSRKEEHMQIATEDLNYVLARLPETRDLCSEDYTEMVTLLTDQWVDIGMSKVVNSAFLNLVTANYWKLMESGDLRPGSKESEINLTSIRVSLSQYSCDLRDFKTVRQLLHQEINQPTVMKMGSYSDKDMPLWGRKCRCVGRIADFVHSMFFNMVISVAIVLNSIQVAVEEAARVEDSHDHDLVWLTLDAIFTFIFVGEFVAKFIAMGGTYFKNPWNRFDFFLAALGVFGLTMGIIVIGANTGDERKESKISGEARIIRVARVLRTLRFLRVFRLFHARLSADKFVSLDLANHMVKLSTWTAFAQAHLMSQEDLIKYFGGNGKIDEVEEAELARCVLQSQVGVYRAVKEVVATQNRLAKPLLEEIHNIVEMKAITENLERFVLDAHNNCALSSREAHTILHHLHHTINQCLSLLYERSEGLIDASMSKKMEESECQEGRIRVSKRTFNEIGVKFGHTHEFKSEPTEPHAQNGSTHDRASSKGPHEREAGTTAPAETENGHCEEKASADCDCFMSILPGSTNGVSQLHPSHSEASPEDGCDLSTSKDEQTSLSKEEKTPLVEGDTIVDGEESGTHGSNGVAEPPALPKTVDGDPAIGKALLIS